MPAQDSAFTVERRSIDFIPEHERHGSPSSLFTVWFAANVQITAAVTGALTVVVGLGLPWALVAVVVGNLAGALFMALHSAQGPRLGIPQMIQSRAQFGYYGAIIPLVLVILMYLGYFASGAVLSGQALAGMTGMPVDAGILLFIAVSAVLAIIGYRIIHRFGKVASAIGAVAFLYLTVRLVATQDMASTLRDTAFAPGPFLLALSLVASWQLTFAPYVADYSRYLPSGTSIRAAFWWTYAGTVLGAVWGMGFGAAAAAVAGTAFRGHEVDYIVGLGGPALAWLLYLVVVLGKATVSVLDLYGGFMSAATTVSALTRSDRVTRAGRAAYVLVIAAVGAAMAIAGRGDFLANFKQFLLFLLYFLTPWTAINLVDFYWIRRERYVIAAIFDPDGPYGKAGGPALLAYLVGALVQVPFVSTDFYTGPLVEPLGGADIAWLVGLAASGAVYWGLMRRRPLPELAEAPVAPSVALSRE